MYPSCRIGMPADPVPVSPQEITETDIHEEAYHHRTDCISDAYCGCIPCRLYFRYRKFSSCNRIHVVRSGSNNFCLTGRGQRETIGNSPGRIGDERNSPLRYATGRHGHEQDQAVRYSSHGYAEPRGTPIGHSSLWYPCFRHTIRRDLNSRDPGLLQPE